MRPLKVVIAGIGAVGGYFGGLLARQYQNSTEAAICFIARGANLQQIKKHGLQVISHEETFIARPKIVTNNATDIGMADFVVVCTKSYDLESMIGHIRPCISKDTVIVPLLNGVDSATRINKLLPNTTIWPGFAYIVVRLKAPGVVENTGNIQKLYFGLDDTDTEAIQGFETLLQSAGIEAQRSDDISMLMWEKYIFISPLASLTSYLDKNRGEIMENTDDMQVLISLIDEVIAVAQHLKVALPDEIRERTLRKLQSLTRDTTSSMHHDFKNERRTELETLTGYVVHEGRKLGVPTPEYEKIYHALTTKAH
jgi:2-dehydropantoate 2-reductase